MSQEEVLHDESEGDAPSFTELEPAAPSEHDYNMSYQSGTSSQYYSHEESQLPSEEDLSEDEKAVFGGAVQLCLDAKESCPSLGAFSSTPKEKNR